MEIGRLGRSKSVAVLDTSALLLIAEGQVTIEDLIGGLDVSSVVVPDIVVLELQRLASKQDKKGRLAQWVLSNLIPALQCIATEYRDRPVDEALIELSRNTGFILVTADTELAKRALRSGVRVAIYRSAKRRFVLLTG
ncbi:MAG TPA: hypothetical protein EYH02_00275 [Ignisphaera aggregans]|uniref:VapC9 PIN-like domain-containing protein n=1 Tax=Ignisphaera aggregans TaxID=334771 RepID=A0A832Z1X2_9CREN|nr:hypothetical protein [Ignisphaera aggregans]